MTPDELRDLGNVLLGIRTQLFRAYIDVAGRYLNSPTSQAAFKALKALDSLDALRAQLELELSRTAEA